MSALSKRVDKLSGATGDDREMVMLINRDRLPTEDLIRANGHDPDDPSKHYYIIQFVSPEDVRNGLA